MHGDDRQSNVWPLREFGNALVACMLAILVAVGISLVLVQLSTGTSGPRPWNRFDHGVVVGIDVAILAWSVAFLVWFWRARSNAGHLGYPQRYRRGWAFWGWVVPVASLWIPFRIMYDLWQPGQAAGQRGRRTWLLRTWWTAWLLTGLGTGSTAAHRDGSGLSLGAGLPQLSSAGGLPLITTSFVVLAGVLLAAIIRVVSAGPLGCPPPLAESSGGWSGGDWSGGDWTAQAPER